MATAKRFAKWSLIPADHDVRSSMHVYCYFFSLLVAQQESLVGAHL